MDNHLKKDYVSYMVNLHLILCDVYAKADFCFEHYETFVSGDGLDERGGMLYFSNESVRVRDIPLADALDAAKLSEWLEIKGEFKNDDFKLVGLERVTSAEIELLENVGY